MPSTNHREKIRYSTLFDFVDGIFGEDTHAKRAQSLACATLGVIESCSSAQFTISDKGSLRPTNSSKNTALSK
jgi:hypothetical protein